MRNVDDAVTTAARGLLCPLHWGQAQPPLESTMVRVPPGYSGRASLPACWVCARLGHHAACAALDESENGKIVKIDFTREVEGLQS